MRISENTNDMLIWIHERLLRNNIDYRITGLTAVNMYGYGITTNCFDISVESDEKVSEAVEALELPTEHLELFMNKSNFYVHKNKEPEFWVRIEGDILGEPTVHPYTGVYLHSKPLLLRRLEIYSKYSAVVLKACAFIALTIDEETSEKYHYYWNRL